MTVEERRAELRAATLLGVRWISIARVVAETTALASSVVLARLIPPADFGRAAVAMTVVALAVIIGPAGVTAPVVQRRTLEPVHREAAVFLSLAVGLSLTVLTIAFAEGVGEALFGLETARLLELAAAAWLIVGIGAASQAMLQRELRFRRIAVVDSASVLVGAATSLALAGAGVDAEAIVVGGLVASAVGTIIAVALSPPARPRPSRRGLAELGAFAAPVSLSSLVYSLFRNVDYAILGARMSAASVGFYWRAYQLGVEYQGKISQIMLRISFPVYARSESLDDLRRLRMRIVRVHATVLVPLLAAFVALAPVVVPWLFGSAWRPAVAPAQIMALAGMGDALVTGTGPLLVAMGRPGALLAWNAGELLAYAAMIFVLAPHGLVTVAVGVAAFSVLSVALTQIVLLRGVVGLPLRQFVAEISPGVVVGGCVVAALSGLRLALEGAALPTVVLIGFLAVVGTAVYVAALRTLFNDVWADLVSIVRRIGGAERVASASEA